MENLRELVFLVNRNKLRALEVADYTLNHNSKLSELYQGLVEDRFVSDEDAAEQLYPDEESRGNYRKLKHNLSNRLLDLVFLVDLNDTSSNDYQKAYYDCYKQWAAVKILLGKNARRNAMKLAKKVLACTEKFEFTELSAAICKVLRLHYGEREGKFKEFQHYNTLYKRYQAILNEESEAEELYLQLVINYVNNKSTKKALYQTASSYYEQIKQSLETYDSYQLQLYGYLIRLTMYTSINDYVTTVKICDEAINFYECKDFEAHVPLQIFYYQKLVCYIQLRKFEAGLEAAHKCLSFIAEGSFNWFKYNELYLILHLHTKEYQKAYELYNKVINHPKFAFLPSSLSEMWQIYEAYIYYLILNNRVTIQADDKYFTKFKVGRFMNSTPIFSKDKRGMNISILIIQILFFIQEKKYVKAVAKTDAIKQYSYRYLHQDDTFRSNCFVKMLMLIPKCHFHQAAVKRKTASYLKKLAAVPMEVSGQTYEVEIIPYEELWEFVLENLGNEFKYAQE